MDGLRSTVALLVIIAKQNPPVASAQDQGCAPSRRPAAYDKHIYFHVDHLHSLSYGTFPKAGNPIPPFIR